MRNCKTNHNFFATFSSLHEVRKQEREVGREKTLFRSSLTLWTFFAQPLALLFSFLLSSFDSINEFDLCYLLITILALQLSLISPNIGTKRSAPHLSSLAEHFTSSRDAPTSFESIGLSDLSLCQQYTYPTPYQTPEERTLHVNSSKKPTERQTCLCSLFLSHIPTTLPCDDKRNAA